MIETAWIIEKKNSPRKNPKFFGGFTEDALLSGSLLARWRTVWTYELREAVRFCRELDARCMTAAIGSGHRFLKRDFQK